jgi:hypothetical protein
VCDQEISRNEEAKARYWVVENTTTMGCNARKTNKRNIIPVTSNNTRDGEREMAGSDYFIFLVSNQISGIFLSSFPPAPHHQ